MSKRQTAYPKLGTMIRGYKYAGPITFTPEGWISSGQFPAECIEACSHSGDCYEDVRYWVARLKFEVPRERAIDYLREFGAWEVEEMTAWDDARLACTVLWVACGDIAETGEWLGLVH